MEKFIEADQRQVQTDSHGAPVAWTCGIQIAFEPGGVAISSTSKARWTIRWSLASIAGAPSEETGALQVVDARVTSNHGAIRESWENRAEGIEHSITVLRRSGEGSDLTVRVHLHGGEAEQTGRDRIVIHEPGGQEVLAYQGLHVSDARGRTLDAEMAVVDGEVAITVADRDAVYPILIDPLLTSPSWTSSGDGQAGALFGASLSTAGDVNGDGFADVLVGAPGFSTVNQSAGKAYLFLGSASGLSTVPAWTTVGDGFNTRLGTSVSTAGDVNGDGFSDVIVGQIGTAFVFHGSATGLSATPNWTVVGSEFGDSSFGVQVSTAGDVNGDGFSDVIIGSQDFNAGAGKVYVYHGSVSGLSAAPNWTAVGDNQSGAEFGYSVASAGDVNGDGFSDVIVGAIFFGTSNPRAGKAYVYHGSAAGLSTTPNWTSVGQDIANMMFGTSVSSAGDVNGDGFSDVIVGAQQFFEPYAGKAYVFHGSAAGLSTTANWTSIGDNVTGAQFGMSVAGAGDVNGDGFSDVIVGAPGETTSASHTGKAFVYLGSAAGLASSPAWTSSGEAQAEAFFGNPVAGAGDVNGDGFSDVLVGATHFDTTQTDAGKAYLYLGSGPTGGGKPAPPSLLIQSDGPRGNPQPPGFVDPDHRISFRATLSAELSSKLPLRLQVEIKPNGISFTGSGLLTGSAVGRGQPISEVNSPALPVGPYHWRARVLDGAGHASDWVEFDPAPGADFFIMQGS